jgi:hypothetical protein
MPVIPPKLRSLFVSLGFIGLCALFYFLRRPSITLEPVLYAEDGSIFLQTAINSGFASLFQTYAGYSHLLQRLVALFAVNKLSPLDYPRFFLVVAWASYLLPLCCMEVLIRKGLYGRIMRLSYIPYVFYPYAQETYLNLPNAYIFFPLGFILIVFGIYGRILEGCQARPLRLWSGFKLLVFIYGVVAALTGPFVAIYSVPLMLFVAIRRRRLLLPPAWLTLPVLLSCLQLYLSQLHYSYPVTTSQAIGKLLTRPDVLLDWFTIHMVSPLFGGYLPGRYLRLLPQPLQLLLVAIMVAVVVLAVRVVSRRIRRQSPLYLSIFSTLLLSFSSLLMTLRRGASISELVSEDGGGRFFFWNTVLFLSILLIAFFLLVQNQATRQEMTAKILAVWLVLAISFYHNNFSSRSVSLPYDTQLAFLCEDHERVPRKIEVFAGLSWGFYLKKPQLDKLCLEP